MVTQSHHSPGGWASLNLPVTSGITFQKLILRKTSWTHRGPYLRPCPWEAEKGEGEGQQEGQWEVLARLWKAISGGWEMTFSVRLALAAKLPPLPKAPTGLCCGPGQWGCGQGITLVWGLRARGTEGLG